MNSQLKLRIKKVVSVILLCIAFSGCSSRALFQENALTPAFNLYNRNFIVAAPTAVGNFVCGAPLFLLTAGVIAPAIAGLIGPDTRGVSESYTYIINGIYFVPATMCSAITGLAFIPLSYICPENPWDYGFKTYRNVNLKCEREERGFEIKWNLGPKDSSIEQDILVTRDRVYRLDIVFRSIYGSMSDEERKQAFKFTGDGTYHYVTKESADTDVPTIVPEYTQEELDFLKSGGSLVQGTYFKNHPLEKNERLHNPPTGTVRRSTKTGAGVIVTVHVRIEQIGDDGVPSLHTDELSNTDNIAGWWEEGIACRITTIALKPGHYRLRATTVRETPLPPNIQTYLRAVKDLVPE